jgi:hypothetical protein
MISYREPAKRQVGRPGDYAPVGRSSCGEVGWSTSCPGDAYFSTGMPCETGCGIRRSRVSCCQSSMRLLSAIDEEASKLIRRFENYARQLADESQRRARRTTQSVPRLVLKRPPYWSLAMGFDPYFVRARATCITNSVENKLTNKTYAPFTPCQHFVPKMGGRRREVCVFQVADSAVSRIFY